MGPVAGGTPGRTGGTAGVQEGHTAPGLNLPPTSSRKSQQLPNMALAQLVIASLVSTCAVVNGQSADYNPLYIGKFEDLTHSVKGDIFVLDEKTIYIQDFSHDGQAPDVFFWADGTIIPYITRNDLQPKIGLERFLPREDIVLLLPKEKPPIHNIVRLEVWCRAFGISFGHIDFPDFAKK